MFFTLPSSLRHPVAAIKCCIMYCAEEDTSLVGGDLGRTETGNIGQPRTLSKTLRSDFLVKEREKWDLSQVFHEGVFLEELVESSSKGSSDNGARRLI